MVAYIRMEKKKTLFFFARKFRQRLDSEAEVCYFQVLTWRYSLPHTHVTYHTLDLNRNVFKMAVD